MESEILLIGITVAATIISAIAGIFFGRRMTTKTNADIEAKAEGEAKKKLDEAQSSAEKNYSRC